MFGKKGNRTAVRTLNLESGGSLTLSCSIDLFSLSPDDRAFVHELVDSFLSYDVALQADSEASKRAARRRAKKSEEPVLDEAVDS